MRNAVTMQILKTELVSFSYSLPQRGDIRHVLQG